MKLKLPTIHNPLFAITLGVIAVAAFAQAPARAGDSDHKAPEWSDSDTDRDGFLSRDELIPFPGVLKKFDLIDTDGDNRISEQEYRDWRESKKR